MKISVNDIELFTITDTKIKVIKDYMPADIFEDDMKRRITWIIDEIYKESLKGLKSRWDDKLEANGVESIPFDKDAYATLVFAQPDYKDRMARDLELKA